MQSLYIFLDKKMATNLIPFLIAELNLIGHSRKSGLSGVKATDTADIVQVAIEAEDVESEYQKDEQKSASLECGGSATVS